ncbi:hypothetical protein TNCV_2056961 [Trichonephila clavipes]|nr:hypothetical protein TNCV_2056961 [Trichonephila clavipes]
MVIGEQIFTAAEGVSCRRQDEFFVSVTTPPITESMSSSSKTLNNKEAPSNEIHNSEKRLNNLYRLSTLGGTFAISRSSLPVEILLICGHNFGDMRLTELRLPLQNSRNDGSAKKGCV